jgi:signal transduction histidine kinase
MGLLRELRSTTREALVMVGWATVLGCLFFGLGVVSERTTFAPYHSASIWLPSGLMLAMLVRVERRHWGILLVAIFLAELAKVLVLGGVLPLALTWAAANCLRALLGAALLCAWAGRPVRLQYVREVAGLILFGGLLGPLVSATLGAASTVLWLEGAAPFAAEWRAWFLADSLGALLLAPLLLTWWPLPRELARPRCLAALALVLGAVAVVCHFVLGGSVRWAFPYLPFPLLICAAFWLGPAGTAAAVAALVGITLGDTVAGRGPFSGEPVSREAQLFATQAYLAVMGLSASAFAALVAERRATARTHRFLADVGVLLAESLDARRTLSRIAERVVPKVATGFAAWVAQEDGRLVQVAGAGVGPEHHSVLAAHLVPPLHRWVEPSGRIILVPMSGREKPVGALVLVSEERLRPLRARERCLAEELARRCALAVENAQLFDRSQQAVHARDEFIAIAAHELRTPLTALHLQLGTLMRSLSQRPVVESMRRKLQQAIKQVMRLSRLVDSLLDVGRIHSGRLELSREEVRLDELVRTTAERFREQFERAGCPLLLRLEDDVTGEWDRLRIEQVLTNLLSNAVKFGAGHPIEVEVSRAGDRALLRVRDHGVGMDAQALARVFGRFEQAVSPREYGGLGLGLYLAQEIVEAHGGWLHATSRPGEGATFTVELPALPEVAPGHGGPGFSEQAAEGMSPAGAPP